MNEPKFKFGDRVKMTDAEILEISIREPDVADDFRKNHGTVVKLDHVHQCETMPNVVWDHLPDLACFYDQDRLELVEATSNPVSGDDVTTNPPPIC